MGAGKYLDNTLAPVIQSQPAAKTEQERTDHAPKALLASSVPELEADLEAVDMDLLCDEKGAASGGGVLWLELVLSVPLEEGGLADARITHHNDLGVDAVVDAMVEAGADVGVHRWTTTAQVSSRPISSTTIYGQSNSELARPGSHHIITIPYVSYFSCLHRIVPSSYVCPLLLRHYRELKYNILASQPAVHRRKRVKLVLE